MSRPVFHNTLLGSLQASSLQPRPFKYYSVRNCIPSSCRAESLTTRSPSQSFKRQTRHVVTAAERPQPQSSNSLPTTFLTRRSAYDRQLPPLSALNSSYRWLKTMPIFLGIITISSLALFNYQKVNSPIIAANLYSLRTNLRVREILGEEVYFASKWAWIFGQINLVQGRVNVEFEVGGRRRKGWCRFRARRVGGRNGPWKTEEWSLRIPGGSERIDEVLDLLEGVEDPMAGASF